MNEYSLAKVQYFRIKKSGEYRSQLDSALTKIVRDCDHSDSEAHTSSIFETEIYYLVRHQT